jgi:hypothetical protein
MPETQELISLPTPPRLASALLVRLHSDDIRDATERVRLAQAKSKKVRPQA